MLDNILVEKRINVFDDTFSTSGATVGNDANDPNDTAWSSLSGSATLSIVSDAVIDSGSAMSVVTSGDFRNVLTSFADVDLAVGEKIVASFDLRLTQFANVGQGIRFGLYDDPNNLVANTGYFATFGTGTTGGVDFNKDLATGGSLFGGSGNVGLGSSAAFNFDESTAHFVEWIITRTGPDAALLELYVDGMLKLSVVDSAGAFSRFGAFGFLNGGTGASTDFVVDNLVIDFTLPIPEPATFSMGLLGLTGLALRRRRQA